MQATNCKLQKIYIKQWNAHAIDSMIMKEQTLMMNLVFNLKSMQRSDSMSRFNIL